MRNKAFSVLATVLAAMGLWIAAAPAAGANTASINAACDGGSCNGLDPIAAGCAADAITPQGASFTGPRGKVELRYSPTCHANWAKITNSSPGTWFWVQNALGDNQQFYVPAGSTNAYTDMVNGYLLARAGDLDGHTGWY